MLKHSKHCLSVWLFDCKHENIVLGERYVFENENHPNLLPQSSVSVAVYFIKGKLSCTLKQTCNKWSMFLGSKIASADIPQIVRCNINKFGDTIYVKEIKMRKKDSLIVCSIAIWGHKLVFGVSFIIHNGNLWKCSSIWRFL